MNDLQFLTKYELIGLMYDTNSLPECSPTQEELLAFAKLVQIAYQAKSRSLAKPNHSGLIKRIDAAIDRVTQGRGLMSIPANPRSDVDLVLAECKALLEGDNPPFWATEFHQASTTLVAQEILISVANDLYKLSNDAVQVGETMCAMQIADLAAKIENAMVKEKASNAQQE